MLVALPLASCLVPTFDLQPDDGGPDGGFGGDSSGGAGSGSGGEASDSGGAVGDGGNTSGGASSGGNDPGAGGADTGGTDSGGTSGGGTQNGSGGAESSGGTSGSGGGPDVDANGKENALPGSTLSAPGDYLRMGELRLVPDRTGSDSIDCGTAISVFTETEPSVSWTFDRPSNCGSTGAPDFPHVEFGVQPYGLEPRDFSSTSLLPTFIQDISSLSVDIQGLAANFQSSSDWTLELTFWLNMANPEVSSDPLVYVEVSVLFAWQNARWPSSPGAEGSGDVGTPPGSVASGGESYTLWVKRDDWNGHIFYEFRHDAGPLNPFSGLVDLREFLDYLADDGIGGTVWLTDIQVGGEFDNGTSGEVTLSDITFEVNGEERSPDFK